MKECQIFLPSTYPQCILNEKFSNHIRYNPQTVKKNYTLHFQNLIYLDDRSILYLKVRHYVLEEFKLRHAKIIREWNIKKDGMIREDIEFIDEIFLLLNKTYMHCTQRGLSPCLLEKSNKPTSM